MSNALSRSEELARKIRDYQDFKEAYDFRVTERAQTKARIMRHLVATDEDFGAGRCRTDCMCQRNLFAC